jgi:hypothetical protein
MLCRLASTTAKSRDSAAGRGFPFFGTEAGGSVFGVSSFIADRFIVSLKKEVVTSIRLQQDFSQIEI